MAASVVLVERSLLPQYTIMPMLGLSLHQATRTRPDPTADPMAMEDMEVMAVEDSACPFWAALRVVLYSEDCCFNLGIFRCLGRDSVR
jgi:hypothetical protein